MKNTIIAMAFASIACFTPVTGVSVSYANEACVQKVVCPEVPEVDYHGTTKVRPKIWVTVCFTDRDHKIITLPDGTNGWVVHLRYQRSGGFDRIETMRNAQCRLQGVVPGTTRIAVYVTCPEYTGWVATPVVTKEHDGKTVTMERVSGPEWSFIPS
jgi:hypothetical protein